MSGNFQELVEKYHAQYEVLPYYVLVEEKHGSRKGQIKNRIQSGFDVDVYGVSDKDTMELPPAPDLLGRLRGGKENRRYRPAYQRMLHKRSFRFLQLLSWTPAESSGRKQ